LEQILQESRAFGESRVASGAERARPGRGDERRGFDQRILRPSDLRILDSAALKGELGRRNGVGAG
jgi:hypothetical protein